MRIGIITDTHGNKKAIDEVLHREPMVELWLHAGDYTRDGEYLTKMSPVPVKMIAGNNDVFFGNKYPEEMLFKIKEQNIWLTHGHHHGVKWNLNILAEECRKKAADIVVFGHTHEAIIEYIDGIILINSGGATAWDTASYAILEIDDDGKISAELKNLE